MPGPVAHGEDRHVHTPPRHDRLRQARLWHGRPWEGRFSPAPLLAASMAAVLLLGLTASIVAGASTIAPKCDGVRLRTGPSVTNVILAEVRTTARLTVVSKVSGGKYRSACGATTVSGSTWYRISAVNGKSTSSLYGHSTVYAASALFKTLATTPAASPALPAPSPGASGAPASPDPGASAPAPALPPGAVLLTNATEFFGRGWGHGVGMSQYGAKGRAIAGQSATTILAHYYPGTAIGTTSNTQVRVLLMSGFGATGSNPLRIYGRDAAWTIDGLSGTFPADAELLVTPDPAATTGWHLHVQSAAGTALFDGAAPATSFRVRPATGALLQLYSKPTSYDRFRGVLRVIGSSSGTLSVVNELPLESYLRGVVPAEMSASWPTEALKAQAIAARSYAAYRLHPGSGTWDVHDDSRSQVYRGVLAEHSASNSAISATAGKVVTYKGSIADTLFHSADGGWTEDNENVFVTASGAVTAGPVAYLRGTSDRAPDGSSYDAGSPWATWHTSTYTLAQMQDVFAADSRTDVGSLIALDLTNRGVSGRLISVTLFGADGTTKTVSGGVFIAVFNANTPAADQAIMGTLVDLAPIQ